MAQSIFDLTGNKNPLLRAIQAEITRQIKIRNAAKKGTLAFKEAQTAINDLLLKRKNLNEDLQKEDDSGAAGGPSLVDLFTRA